MKIFVIGLDGADFDLLTALVSEGKLPNIRELMDQGVSGPLRSVLPPISAPAWASFMTGNNPGKHGVFAFLEHEPGLLDIDSQRLVTADSIQSHKLWDILKETGKSTHVVNVPVTYPPSKISGVMIPGFDAPGDASDFFHPPRIKQEIEELLGHAYAADHHSHGHLGGERLDKWTDILFKIEEDRAKVVHYLMDAYPWDFFVVVFTLLDRIGHLCWHNRPLMQKAYEKADLLVGSVLGALEEETTVICLSDHGFGDLKGHFVTNKWLYDQGFLHLNPINFLNFYKFYRIRPTDITIERFLKRLGRKSFLSYVPPRIHDKCIPIPLPQKKATALVDWSATTAYGGSYGIYVNLKGREPQGIVDPGRQYEKLRDGLIECLHDVEDPQTGEKLVSFAVKREEIYCGPFSERAPDIFFCLDNFNHIQVNHLNVKKTFVKASLSGTHRLNGVFLAKGQGMKRNFPANGARIIDVAPTILYTFGLPILRNMDGALLEQCFEPDYLAERPPTYETVARQEAEEADRRLLDKEETEEVAQRLRQLGYLE